MIFSKRLDQMKNIRVSCGCGPNGLRYPSLRTGPASNVAQG